MNTNIEDNKIIPFNMNFKKKKHFDYGRENPDDWSLVPQITNENKKKVKSKCLKYTRR